MTELEHQYKIQGSISHQNKRTLPYLHLQNYKRLQRRFVPRFHLKRKERKQMIYTESRKANVLEKQQRKAQKIINIKIV